MANSFPPFNWGLVIFNLIVYTIVIIFILYGSRIILLATLLKTFYPIGLYNIKLILKLLLL